MSPALKVLLVSSKYPPEYSGSGLRAHNTYKRLAARYGIWFSVLTSSVTENHSGDYEFEGVAVRRIANKLQWQWPVATSMHAGLLQND
jgi:hypothetical protein